MPLDALLRHVSFAHDLVRPNVMPGDITMSTRIWYAALAALAFHVLAPPAAAQSAMPPEIEKRLREIGRVSAPEPTRPLYAPLHAKPPYAGVHIVRDIAYGPAARNRLDVFTPELAAGPRPVLLFMHGGAYVGGDKHLVDTPFYSNIGVWAVRNNMVGVNMTYRLAPQAQWPAAQEDIAAAVRWVKANIASHGGDPNRIYLMGHSAGASHTSNYVAQTQFHGPDGSGLAGAIFVSAFYELEKLTATDSFKKYHGDNPALYAARSPLPGLLKSRLPMLFAVAEFDTPDFNAQADLMRDAFCKQGKCPNLVVLPKHSHMSEIYAVNTEDRVLTDRILAFVKTTE
ncbi:MAG: alpha/beta hydrolase [Variibacter sp.]|nr:alpha/beta hydrolase [Variibacter sp.]